MMKLLLLLASVATTGAFRAGALRVPQTALRSATPICVAIAPEVRRPSASFPTPAPVSSRVHCAVYRMGL